jgi:hypothetical protein
MRFSFIRALPGAAWTALLCCALAGCPQEKTQPAPPPPPVPAPHPIQDSPKPPPAALDAGPSGTGITGTMDAGGSDAGAGSAAAADAGASKVEARALQEFKGFNRDETQFAFSVFSEGAGTHLLQIVVGQQGTPKERFILDSDASIAKAKAALEAGGFTQVSGGLPTGTSVETSVKDGRAQVTLQTPDGPARTLYDGNPFLVGGGGAKVAKATVDKVSPSGQVIAVRVDSIAMTEFGGATTYVLVRTGQPR